MESTDETKGRILEAAIGRFLQYGFNKTTMAEIATDSNMSTANIYRFFKSKDTIIADMAVNCFKEKEESMRELLRIPGMSAAERLEAFILHQLRNGHAMLCEQPKMNEIIEYIHTERHDLIARHIDTNQSIVAEILAEGNRNNEFDVSDIVTTAEAILKATVYFCNPTHFDKRPLEELEKEAEAVIDLITRGLQK